MCHKHENVGRLGAGYGVVKLRVVESVAWVGCWVDGRVFEEFKRRGAGDARQLGKQVAGFLLCTPVDEISFCPYEMDDDTLQNSYYY